MLRIETEEVLQRKHNSSDVTDLKVAEADVLDVGVLVDPVSRSFSSETGFFDSAECGLGCANDALVHTDHADLEGVDEK